MQALRRSFDIAFPLLIAAMLVIVAIPAAKYPDKGRMLELRTRLATELFKPLSMSQQWAMYAPDPARSLGYMHLIAESKGARVWSLRDNGKPGFDGELPPGTWLLEEGRLAETGWGTTWLMDKTRMDIWRYRLSINNIDRPNRNRSWYVRGACVREARAGRFPAYIQMQQLKRRFTKPKRVREGKPGLGAAKFRRSDRTWCASPLVGEMIERDRASNPEAYKP